MRLRSYFDALCRNKNLNQLCELTIEHTFAKSVERLSRMCSTDGKDIVPGDCCGNGCANCILDSNPLSTPSLRDDLKNKINILHSYRKYKLIQRINLTQFIVQLKFNLADDNKKQLTDFIFDCPPEHHIMLRAPIADVAANSENQYVLRPYSPFWTDMREFEFEIVVNLKSNGVMTKFIKNLNINDEVEFRGPIGVFMHEPSPEPGRALIIFTQGVGIAPTMPIVESVLADRDDMTRIYHYSCFQDINNIIFREKLLEFGKFWNCVSKIYLSRQKCDKCEEVDCKHFKKLLKYKENLHSHRLGKDDIVKELAGLGNVKKEVVICGWISFQEFIIESLKSCGVNKESIFVL